jgi:acetoin utilization deacetylase AcuC-like enzyme
MVVITDNRCLDYSAAGHVEKPQRVARTIRLLENQNIITIEWRKPIPITDDVILKVHTKSHLERLNIPGDFDSETPWHQEIGFVARLATAGAVTAAYCALEEKKQAFSLMRPPGHHARPAAAMGFCYLNNIAVAVRALQQKGLTRIAIFDFDTHHGNGTEEIFLNDPDVFYFSVHQYPGYPGTGSVSRNNCANFVVPPRADRELYKNTLEQACREIAAIKPEVLAVSAGFDGYRNDPVGQQKLEVDDYKWLGGILREIGVPMFHVLEGGYSQELSGLIFSYLEGLEGL